MDKQSEILFFRSASKNQRLLVAQFLKNLHTVYAKLFWYEHKEFIMQKIYFFRPLAKAFTLIELMIVIAIIAILATVAIPSYNAYTQKAALSELLQASSSYKSDVELCIYNFGGVNNCSGGSNGIQANKTAGNETKYLNSITVNKGVITVSGKGSLNGYGYTLTPTFSKNTISWTTSCSGDDISLFPASFCSSTVQSGG